MPEPYGYFGGIDFSGAREPLSNLWSAVGREVDGRLRIVALRPHAFRVDLASYVTTGWRQGLNEAGRILWGADFPFGLPVDVGQEIGAGSSWRSVLAWVADRPPDEIRSAAENAGKKLRSTDAGGGLSPLDLRLYKQTVEGIRWLDELLAETTVSIHPVAEVEGADVGLIEVYPSGSARELGLPRRRSPSRAGEARARAAALRTFVEFEDRNLEALAVTLEDAWDATVACLTAYLCRSHLDQPFTIADLPAARIRCEGWIYRPPAAVASP